jgi:hypothetical protein
MLAACKPTPLTEGGIEYEKDSTLSSTNGHLIDSSKFYLPPRFFVDSIIDISQIDTFLLEWYSTDYRCFKADILYNYYLGFENYRFLWLRSFHKPVMITIQKGTRITINTKILQKIPDIWTHIYLPDGEIGSFQDYETSKKDFPLADSIIVPKNDIKIITDTTVYISKKEWDGFLKLADSCRFWKLKPISRVMGLDGAEWILEGQKKDKYQFVARWSPTDSFEKCCEYLIRLSAAKNEMIY